jgi:hypothetical protein
MVLSAIASNGSCRAKLLKTIHLFVACVSTEVSPGSGPEVQRQPQNLMDAGFAPKLHVFSPLMARAVEVSRPTLNFLKMQARVCSNLV